jgi:spermidine synthase
MSKKKPKKKDYEHLYDCIVSDQVSPQETAEYLDDMEFYKYYIKRRTLGGLWKRRENV